ncbi:MAG TPA: M14 family metallopeptidase [Sphingobacteriaceae bacterium]
MNKQPATKRTDTIISDYFIDSGLKGPHILIIAGVHGDEFEPMLAVMNLVRSLQKRIIRGKVTLLPVANQDAYKLGARCASDGLDMARTMPGKEEGSVTQCSANSLSFLIREADYLIDLHTGGSLFDILPLAGYMLHDDKTVQEMQRKMAIAFGLPVIWGTSVEKGRTLSIAHNYSIPAIYAECRGGLAINKNTIKIYEKGCINVLQSLGVIDASDPNGNNYNVLIEDNTPGQGHLQSKLPSPADGVFIPSVKLGRKIKKGSLIGYVIDPLSRERTGIISEEDGLVFMLRISSKVSQGDSLGGILPLVSNKNVSYAE